MTTIISQRHFFKFYIAIFLIDLFWGLMSLVAGALSEQGIPLFGKIMMMVISGGLASMVFYTIFRYYKNVPHIVVNDNSISLNSKVYYWRDLEKIEMTGKQLFRFIGERKEGMLLKFAGEQERYIFDDMYENSPEIKFFIETVISEKTALSDLGAGLPKAINTTEKNTIVHSEAIVNSMTDSTEAQTSESIKWFKGFPLFSFYGIVFFGLILFLLSMGVFDFLRHNRISSIILLITFSFLVFIITCFRWHYFGVSKSDLVIKNYNFPWIKNVYSLKNIKEIVFEETGGRAAITRMRIIMNDFSSKKYPGATLRSKKWMELKSELESKGIKVRNECVNYEPFEFKFFNN